MNRGLAVGRAAGVLVSLAVIGLAACQTQNSFVLGTAPGYSFPVGLKEVDIVDPSQATVAIFFNRCVLGKADGSGLVPADFEVSSQVKSASEFEVCIPGHGLFNFDDCFPESVFTPVGGASVIDGFSLNSTVDDKGKPRCPVGYDKLLIHIKASSLPWLPTDDSGVKAVKFYLGSDLMAANGDISWRPLSLYFIVRNKNGDTTGPRFEAISPASGTGLVTGPPMPAPPHSPIFFSLSEPILHADFLSADITWYDPALHNPSDAPAFPPVTFTITGQKQLYLRFDRGLPPDAKFEFIFLARPDDYDSRAYGNTSSRPAIANLLAPPTIDLFGNDIRHPLERSLVDPDGDGVFDSTYSEATAHQTFVYEGRVGPILIVEPAYGATIPAQYGDRRVKVRALPNVESVKLMVSSWAGLGLPQPYVHLSKDNGWIKPLSVLEPAPVTGPALNPALSSDGRYLFFWARDSQQVFQIFRQDLNSTAALLQISDFSGPAGVMDDSDLRGHPLSVGRDGRTITFRTISDRAGHTINANGELYFWHDTGSEPGEVAELIQLSAEGFFAEAAKNYDPVVSAETNDLFFWSESSPDASDLQPRLLHCAFIRFSAPPQPRFACEAIAGPLAPGPVADSRVSANEEGTLISFSAPADLDSAIGNSDLNPEVFYWDGAVHQVTHTAAPDVNSYPVLFESSPGVLQAIYFLSTGSLQQGSEVQNTDGGAELFVYHSDSSAHEPFEQITYVPAGGGQVLRFVVSNDQRRFVVVSDHDFSDKGRSGINLSFLEPERHVAINPGDTSDLLITHTIWALAINELRPVALPGGPLPFPSLNLDANVAAFSTGTPLLAETEPGPYAYFYHFNGEYVGFDLTWNEIAGLLGEQNNSFIALNQILQPGATFTLKVESDTTNVLGFDQLDFTIQPYDCPPAVSLDAGLDSDGDGLDNLYEFNHGTSPCNFDTDGDGLPDQWEVEHFTDPLRQDALPFQEADSDPDHDGLDNLYEYQLGTDPRLADTDGDGLNDRAERDIGSNPLLSDTDDDGLWDGVEVNQLGTSSANTDSDGDGINDGLEDVNHDGVINSGETNPANADSDGDGLGDHEELHLNTLPTNPDTDGDTMWDGWEVQWGFNPLSLPGDSDAGLDADGDGLTNLQEFNLNHDGNILVSPLLADTDGDGLSDGLEVNTLHTDPTNADTDGDGLSDFKEVNRSTPPDNSLTLGPYLDTNPLSLDTDLDGIPDGVEDADHDGIVDQHETDPTCADTDGDLYSDYAELLADTNPGSTLSKPSPISNLMIAPLLDMDGDGLPNTLESNTIHTNPNQIDSDLDALRDGWEVLYDFTPTNADGCTADADSDGLTNRAEFMHDTNPRVADSDGDQMTDGWEIINGLDPLMGDSTLDPDQDSLANLAEFTADTDPQNPDSDLDAIPDGIEDANTNGALDPANPDSDGDNLPDGIEDLNLNGQVDPGETNPLNPDSDGDQISDGWETHYGFNPLSSTSPGATTDADLDCLSDRDEAAHQTNPFNPDSDRDGMYDGWEIKMGLDPITPDDTVDPDGDGLTSYQEYYFNVVTKNLPCTAAAFMKANRIDSDGDQLPDGWEVFNYPYTDPMVTDALVDADQDGLTNLQELSHGTNPSLPDTDSDGISDGGEISTYNTNPLSSDSDGDAMPDGWEISHSCMKSLMADANNDYDLDHVTNLEEFSQNTNPCNSDDTDTDNMPDDWEIANNVNGATADPDGDGLTNLDEYNSQTAPYSANTDGDSISDYQEVHSGSCPFHTWIKPGSWQLMGLAPEGEHNRRVSYLGGGNIGMPSLTWTGSEYGLFGPGPRFTRLNCEGQSLQEETFLQISYYWFFSTAWSNSQRGWGLYWSDSSNVIWFSRLAPDGLALSPQVRIDSSPNGGSYNAFAWSENSQSFGLSWVKKQGQQYKFCYQRILPADNQLLPNNPLCQAFSEYFSMAADRDRFAFIWRDSNMPNNLFFQRVSMSDSWLESPMNITNNTSSSVDFMLPALLWNGSEYGLFGVRTELGEWSSFFARLSSQGGTSTPFTLHTAQSLGPEAVAWNGHVYAFVFEVHDPSTQLFCAILDPTGPEIIRVLRVDDVDAPKIFNKTPSLVAAGLDFALVWPDPRDYPSCDSSVCPADLYFAKIGADFDGDGLSSAQEALANTLPDTWDTDGDQLDDGFEVSHASCLHAATVETSDDLDGDSVSNLDEYLYRTASGSTILNPCNSDTDGDQMPDGYELRHSFLNPLGNCLNPLVTDGGVDSDGDGLTNIQEYLAGTDPCVNEAQLIDADFDSLPNVWEEIYGLDPNSAQGDNGTDGDFDHDGLSNFTEYHLHTNPALADTDGDQISDANEVACGTSPLIVDNSLGLDSDWDGLINATECDRRTDPYDPDSDGDWLRDGEEVSVAIGTNPNLSDTDGDGLGDGEEVNLFGTGPLSSDSDSDNLPDGWELSHGLNPLSPAGNDGATADPDRDGLINLEEYLSSAGPWATDTDANGFSDKFAHDHGTAYIACNTAPQDADGDSLPNFMEAKIGTNPDLADTDGDGMDDFFEFVTGLNPGSSLGDDGGNGDPDHDGRTNLQEYQNDYVPFTNPKDPDTDGDLLCDGDIVIPPCTGYEGQGQNLLPVEVARLRLVPNYGLGDITVGSGSGGAGAGELLSGSSLVINGSFIPGVNTYEIRLDDGIGHVYWLKWSDCTLSGSTIQCDLSTGKDNNGQPIPAGTYQLVVFKTGESMVPGSVFGSDPITITLRRFTFITSGIHGPTLGSDVNAAIVWRRAYEPFGAQLDGALLNTGH